ncbi:MAG TPA: hypothetical protein VFN85_11805 [Solirubrobacterales bacterium]|nr:hypothetical protein [Solirubrobacterales bacterium]
MADNRSGNVDRDDLLLLIAKGAEEGPYPFDAIRTMKSAFIVSRRGLSEWHGLFDFQPYDYGPFDPSVYRSRDSLLGRGFLQRSGGYDACVVTDEGNERVEQLEALLGENADWLKRIGRWACSRSFAQLLREVYSEYPEFAARSIARID